MYRINEELKKQIIQEERLNMIRNIMKTLNVSSELAMEIIVSMIFSPIWAWIFSPIWVVLNHPVRLSHPSFCMTDQ